MVAPAGWNHGGCVPGADAIGLERGLRRSHTDDSTTRAPDIHFKRITARTVVAIRKLSGTFSGEQRKMVADNALSIAQAHFSENAWMRAIYADDTPVGFLMLHVGSDYDDGIGCPGMFLWRLTRSSSR